MTVKFNASLAKLSYQAASMYHVTDCYFPQLSRAASRRPCQLMETQISRFFRLVKREQAWRQITRLIAISFSTDCRSLTAGGTVPPSAAPPNDGSCLSGVPDLERIKHGVVQTYGDNRMERETLCVWQS
ncbi:hypothetical protein ElyMa_006094200 [Elysia marginata]|uniref:Uncharacterized protein n=1 Tax=Elysia marginata TaxID=1093978 RepID=A0AAV4GS45_9GAST|nr:hypothetical protein ElyMa_006094200 [Elysia marginata]